MSNNQPLHPPVRRRWLRRLGIAGLVAIVVLVVFHRPLFFEGTRYFLVRAAKQQHLSLSYDISGSLFTTLVVSNLKAVPTETGAIQRLEIGQVALRYSLWGLLRKGLPAFLESVEIRDVFVEVTPAEPLPPEKREQPQAFKFPALFPEVLQIANANFLSHGPEGADTVISSLSFTLLPDRPGELLVRTLDIPGVRQWENISAKTTFRNRNLILSGLVLGPEINLRTFNLDASEIEENRLGLGLEGAFFGASVALKARIRDLNVSNKMELQASCTGLSLADVSEYFHAQLPVTGTLANLGITFSGEPEQPRTWAGHVNLNLRDLMQDTRRIGDAEWKCEFKEGMASAGFSLSINEQNRVTLEARMDLPGRLDGFSKAPASGKINISLADMETLEFFQPESVSGSVSLDGSWKMTDGLVSLDAKGSLQRVGALDWDVTRAGVTLHAEKDLLASGQGFRGLVAQISAEAENIRIQEYSVDRITVRAEARDGAIGIQDFSVTKGSNAAIVSGRYVLPDDMASWLSQPFAVEFSIKAPALEELALAGRSVLRGTLECAGNAEGGAGRYSGSFQVNGRDIFTSGLRITTLSGQGAVRDSVLNLDGLKIVFDDRNAISGQGTISLQASHAYRGSLNVALNDLSIFRPLMGQGDDAPVVQGALTADWQGEGDASGHSGVASLELSGGQFADQTQITARLKSTYSPAGILIPEMRVSSNLGAAELAAEWKRQRLTISGLTVRQQDLVVLSGRADLPLDLVQFTKPDLLFPGDQPVSISLRTENLDLGRVFIQLGQKKPPMTGTLNMNASVSGTPDDPVADLSLRGAQLRSSEADSLAPATIAIDLAARNNRLAINGSLRQALIQPLEITGDLPLDMARIRKSGGLNQDTPLDLHVRLPRSSLAFLSSLVPAIRQCRGSAAVDVAVNGTIAQPNLTGRMDAAVDVLRFRDPSLPPINALGVALSFSRQRIAVERLRGGVAGGTFELRGDVDFPRLDNPVFNLRLLSSNALVLQNDDITARVNADLRVTGPLNAGSLAGTIMVTRSSFFKNIDILPIGLPGRPAPQPPADPSVVSFRQPPLRDWRFDVSIRSQDAFLVQGNLANGQLFFDLRLGGTGLAPWLDGSVRIDRLTASLPFSRLDVRSSLVYFTRDRPFVPQLDIHGESNIRDYDVRVNVFGPVTDPRATFVSDPPLPESEIVSLLATGMTTSEIRNNPNAVAGRAAFLLLQKAYRSVFHRNRPPADSKESFLNRITFDVGTTDAKTGKQSTAIRIPLSNNVVLIGSLDVGGNFSGQVKYLLRFK